MRSKRSYLPRLNLGRLVQQSIERSFQNVTPFLRTAALMGFFAHPLFYIIWTTVLPQPFESLTLRALGSLSILPLIFWREWPVRLTRWLPPYYYIAVIYNLPFIFLYFLFQNNLSQIWVLSALGAAFVLTFLIEWRSVAVIYIFGAIAWYAAGDLLATPQIAEQMGPYIIVLLFPIIFGAIFSYQLQKYRLSQANLEHRIRRISEENTRMVQEQNRLFSLFLNNSLVSRLQQFQSQFGLEKAIDMITSREKRFCGIMEADIRNFTKMFDHGSDHDVAQLVSHCFDEITAIGQDLSVIKPVGDSLFIYTDDEDGRELAVTNVVALAILFVQSLEEVNRAATLRFGAPLNFGIAVHAGEAIYGNLASDTFIDPTIIGVNVNMTARLEELTKEPVLQEIIGPNAILFTREATRYSRSLLGRNRLITIDLPGLGLKVRDFPRLRTIFALRGTEAATLYDQAGLHVRSQRAKLTSGHHEVEASTYHGIPYYFEMQGQGEESTWTILIDFGKIPGKILRDYAEKKLGDMRYDLRYGDTQWLVMSTDDTPGMLDETDIEARVHEVIRALEPVLDDRQYVTVARA